MMQNIPMARWIKFGISSLVFILWVIWVGNFWLLLLYPFLFDVYITKKIPWDFWKKRKDGKKPSAVIEWIDALVFALVAVYMINIFLFQNYKIPTSSLEKSLLVGDHLFVSKVSYGPRMPNTPIAFPLVQNTFPITNSKSYSSWPHWDFKRLAGFGDVKRDDIVVFNFPAGDSVPFKVTNPDIYNLSMEIGVTEAARNSELLPTKPFNSAWERNKYFRGIGRRIIDNNEASYGEVLYRPVDRRDNYVKRCVALPGDLFEIRSNQIYINGEKVINPEGLQHNYMVVTDGTTLNDRFFDKIGVAKDDQMGMSPNYFLPLTAAQLKQVQGFKFIKSVTVREMKPDSSGLQTFPHSPDYNWSRDNYGPLKMPAAGETVALNTKNLVLYDRIITAYEGNSLEMKEGEIFINGKKETSYTFKMNYYFMLGDNRHKSADSRFWGFVPEDHIVGKPILVWLSLDKDKGFPASIRWDRFFKIVHKN